MLLNLCLDLYIGLNLSGSELLAQKQAESIAINALQTQLAQRPSTIGALLLSTHLEGSKYLRPEFLRSVSEICRQKKVLLIYDEIYTGLRTGKMFAYQHYFNDGEAVEPDVILFGKGMQISGFALTKVSSRIGSFQPGFFTTRYAPVEDLLRATLILRTIQSERLFQRSANVGNYMLGQLKELAKHFGIAQLEQVAGIGMLMNYPQYLFGASPGNRISPPIDRTHQDVDNWIHSSFRLWIRNLQIKTFFCNRSIWMCSVIDKKIYKI